jgi:hypothetical protein
MSDEGILWAVLRPGAEETGSDAQENVDAGSALAGGHKVPLLVDMRGAKGVDRGARQAYAGGGEHDYCRALALIVDSPLTRAIANFAIKMTQPKASRPVRLFNDTDAARAWLRKFLEGE